MANVKLTQQDIDYIARVVETEVPRSIARRNPEEYDRMVRGVVDTVTNRMASGVFPSSATGVLNQKRQFSKITGPSYLDPYGSVENTPRASPATKNLVTDYIAGRAAGQPTTIGGGLNYANPNFSSKSNLTGWINPMIERGAQMIGVGKNVHWYGTAPNLEPVGDYTLSAESMPGGYIPRPTSPDDLPQAAQADGILNAVNPPVTGLVQREALPEPGAGLLTAYQPASQPTEAQVSLDTLRQNQPQPPMSVADQYASYGAGKVATQQAGLLSQDVAHQRMIDQLNAQKQQTGPINISAQAQPQTAAERMGLQDPAPWQAQPGLIAEQPTTPPASIQTADVPQVSPEQTASVAAPQGGLLTPQGGPRDLAADQALADRVRFGLGAQKAFGAVGGGLLGGMLLGPLGAVAGGLLGNSLGARSYYPPAPTPAKGKTASNGGRRMTRDNLSREGRDMYDQSEQVRNVVDNDLPGLW